MARRTVVSLPQVNVNDEQALVVEWLKGEKVWIREGEPVCTVETTKAVYEVESEAEGYLLPLAEPGQFVKVGEELAVLSSDPEDTVGAAREWIAARAHEPRPSPQQELNYTRKALLVARRLNLDITAIPHGPGKITEQDVLTYHDERREVRAHTGADLVDDLYPEARLEKLLLVGGGDGAVQVLDALCGSRTQKATCIVDDDETLEGKELMGVPVVGKIDRDVAQRILRSGQADACVITISTIIDLRARIYEQWSRSGLPFANVVHPSVHVGSNMAMGTGNVILAFTHLGACARIGHNNFFSAYTNIEHHSTVGSHCSFGPGVLFSSNVKVADRVRFGSGVFVEPYLSIGATSVIASGSIIMRDIPADTVVKFHGRISLRKRP
jgi:sugar O-acyltransferase (sialic acid O-acetyltransferase NeuD family)